MERFLSFSTAIYFKLSWYYLWILVDDVFLLHSLLLYNKESRCRSGLHGLGLYQILVLFSHGEFKTSLMLVMFYVTHLNAEDAVQFLNVMLERDTVCNLSC